MQIVLLHPVLIRRPYCMIILLLQYLHRVVCPSLHLTISADVLFSKCITSGGAQRSDSVIATICNEFISSSSSRDRSPLSSHRTSHRMNASRITYSNISEWQSLSTLSQLLYPRNIFFLYLIDIVFISKSLFNFINFSFSLLH